MTTLVVTVFMFMFSNVMSVMSCYDVLFISVCWHMFLLGYLFIYMICMYIHILPSGAIGGIRHVHNCLHDLQASHVVILFDCR